MSRYLFIAVCNRVTWDAYFSIPTDVKLKLEFWGKNSKSLPNLVVCPKQKTPKRIVFSDTSSYASAGFLDGNILNIVHGMFSEEEKLKSSTWRELKSIEFEKSTKC